MKKPFDFLILLAPIFLWLLGTLLLGEQFSLPNRLVLMILCCSVGAAALLTNRKLPGVLALLAGLLMLGSVPVSHEVPQANFAIHLRQVYGDQDQMESPIWEEMECAEATEIIAFSNANALKHSPKMMPQHPFQYASCQENGPTIYARSPIENVTEKEKLGGKQLRWEIFANDTCVSMAILDLSMVKSQLDTHQILNEFLQKDQAAAITLIDTGNGMHNIPESWTSLLKSMPKLQTIENEIGAEFSFRKQRNSIVVLNGNALPLVQSAEIQDVDPSQSTSYRFGI